MSRVTDGEAERLRSHFPEIEKCCLGDGRKFACSYHSGWIDGWDEGVEYMREMEVG